jgi:hypothetical protein
MGGICFCIVVLCHDGNVKAVKAPALGVMCTLWVDARCKCHTGKNLGKWLAKEMPKLTCAAGASRPADKTAPKVE